MITSRNFSQSFSKLNLENWFVFFTFALLISISILISPRFSLTNSGQSVDLRLQDILVGFSIFLFASKRFRDGVLLLNQSLKFLPFIFIIGAILITTIAMISSSGQSLLRIIGYGFRPIETIYLALVLGCLLMIIDGPFPMKLYQIIKIVLVANFIWVIIQKILGFSANAIILPNSESITTYGPKLIGEGSVFGAGQLFIFLGCIALSEVLIFKNKLSGILLLVSAYIGEILVDSRASIIGLGILTLFAIVAKKDRPLSISPTKIIFLLSVVMISSPLWVSLISGRLALDRLIYSIDFRNQYVWGKITTIIFQNPFLAVGPGGFGSTIPTEAHNLFLRSLAEWGVPIGLLYIFTIFSTFFLAVIKCKDQNSTTTSRFFSLIYIYFFINVIVSGLVQDSLSAVMPSHLWALSLGLFLGTNIKFNSPVFLKSDHITPRNDPSTVKNFFPSIN